MEGWGTSSITYYGPPDLRSELKVSVNCKYWPKDTKISYPEHIYKNWRKTTLCRVQWADRHHAHCHGGEWFVLEDRVNIDYVHSRLPECGIEKMCIFRQPPRKTIQNESYFCQIPTCMQADDPTEIRMFNPFTDKNQVGTMSKKQKTLAN